MDNNEDHVSRLCDRIDAATKDSDNETVFAALITMFTYRMSLACPNCRKVVARHLKECIPEMFANANREAAAREDEGMHMCH